MGTKSFRGKTKHNNMKRACLFCVLFFALDTTALSALSGCSSVTEEDNIVILQNEDDTVEEVAGNLPVEYSDVVSTVSVSCRYRAAVTQDLSFDVERAKIDSVLVAAGEEVRRGQLLISVENNTDLDAERANILYQIERLELLKEQALHKKEYELSVTLFDIAMSSLGGDEREEAEREARKNLDEKYYSTLQGYDDDIALNYLRLDFLEQSNVDHNIYATMDGIVEYVREGLEGSKTVIGKTVITLKDPSDMYFYASDPSDFSYFSEGDTVLIDVSGANAGSYEAIPEFSDDGSSLRFILTGDSASMSVAEGTGGFINLEVGRREGVLSVPKGAVHYAGDMAYVYVVDADGHRKYREVTVGLIGDTRTEIVSGLNAGDIFAVNF